MARGTINSDWTVAYDPTRYKHLPYDGRYGLPSATEYWAADYTFDGTLKVGGYEKGRSSVTVQWKDNTGFQYSMFFAEFMKLVPMLVDGELWAKWGFEKNGSNTGLYCVSA